MSLLGRELLRGNALFQTGLRSSPGPDILFDAVLVLAELEFFLYVVMPRSSKEERKQTGSVRTMTLSPWDRLEGAGSRGLR
jgi:hypothetical protein